MIKEGLKDSASTHDVPTPVMLSGSKVLSGEGKMVVIAVGKFSAIGKIQSLLEAEEETVTPL
jgi:magnesium-transporting ATPase (P-type)